MNLKALSRLILLPASMLAVAASFAIAAEEIVCKEATLSSDQEDSGVPLVYSPRYNITAFGLEKLHPFDGSKYKKIRDYLVEANIRNKDQFLCPQEVTEEQLLAVHTPHYLKTLGDSRTLASILEVAPASLVPGHLLDWRILRPMRAATGGTLKACRFALDSGVAINIGGGYHHADSSLGGGFCVYSDVPLAIEILRREKLIDSALIVDTDAHQGNGFANQSRKQSNTFVLDFYDESIYPYPKVEEDFPVPLRSGTAGGEYLSIVKRTLPDVLDKCKPDLVVYNAGSDVLASDKLSTLQVQPAELNERDLYVVSAARDRNIPIAMVLAGGYSSESAMAQARSIEAIVLNFDRF